MPYYCNFCSDRNYVVDCKDCQASRDQDPNCWNRERMEVEFHKTARDANMTNDVVEKLWSYAERMYDIGRS